MSRILLSAALAAMLAACGNATASRTPSPAATQAASLPSATPADDTPNLVDTAVAATLTALAPSATPEPPPATATNAVIANNAPSHTVAPVVTPTPLPSATPLPTAVPPTDTLLPTPIPPTETPPPTAVPPTSTTAPTEAPRDQTDYSTVPIFNEKNGLEGTLNVAGQTVIQGPNPFFGDDIVIRLFVKDPAKGGEDGAGLKGVTFEIQGPDGRIVHRRTERTPGYCAFGGGEPTCNRWRFSEHNSRWPELDGEQADVKNGSHFVAMTIERENGEATTWNFSFEIQR